MRPLLAAIALACVALAGCQAPAPPPADEGTPGAAGTPSTSPDAPQASPSTSTSTAPAAPAASRLHWSGVVEVTESMLFFPWETLTIAPGTTVRFHSLPDGDLRATPWVPQADAYIIDNDDPTGHEGYKQSHFTLTGRIHAVGTAAEPILFTSAEDEPGYADWNQLTLLSGSRLENVTTEYTHNGITVKGDDVLLANVVARESLWSCIDVYGTRVTLRGIEAYHCWHSAIGFKGTGANTLGDAYAHDSQVGVNCELGAAPAVSDVRVAATGVAGSCPQAVRDAIPIEARASDSPGGTYKGELVYPAPPFG